MDAGVMVSAAKSKFGRLDNAIGVLFPWAARFRVALEGVVDGNCHGAIQLNAKTVFTPFSTLVIDRDRGGNLGRRRVGAGVLGTTTADLVSHLGCKSKEQTLDRLCNTQGTSGGDAMQGRGRIGGDITAVAGTVGSISFCSTLPVRTKDNGTRRAWDSFAKHLECVELVQLLAFASKPISSS